MKFSHALMLLGALAYATAIPVEKVSVVNDQSPCTFIAPRHLLPTLSTSVATTFPALITTPYSIINYNRSELTM